MISRQRKYLASLLVRKPSYRTYPFSASAVNQRPSRSATPISRIVKITARWL